MFGGLTPQKPPWILVPVCCEAVNLRILFDTDNRIFRWNTYKNIGKLVTRLTGFVCTKTGKHSEKFLKNAKNKNLLKIKRILNTEIQGNRGPIFYIFPARGVGAARTPASPSVTPLLSDAGASHLAATGSRLGHGGSPSSHRLVKKFYFNTTVELKMRSVTWSRFPINRLHVTPHLCGD